MKNVVSRTLISVAALAGVISLAWPVFLPHGHPWPSLAWGVLACAVAVWVGMSTIRAAPRMSEVIGDVEAESTMDRGRVDARSRVKKAGKAEAVVCEFPAEKAAARGGAPSREGGY